MTHIPYPFAIDNFLVALVLTTYQECNHITATGRFTVSGKLQRLCSLIFVPTSYCVSQASVYTITCLVRISAHCSRLQRTLLGIWTFLIKLPLPRLLILLFPFLAHAYPPSQQLNIHKTTSESIDTRAYPNMDPYMQWPGGWMFDGFRLPGPPG
jgi:hypothetical protein